jgi:predicted RNase H-like HicB family nuclease
MSFPVDWVMIYSIMETEMELQYTYRQEKDVWFLGYLNDYPEHWTQGKTITELEEMLAGLYELGQEEHPKVIPERKVEELVLNMV